MSKHSNKDKQDNKSNPWGELLPEWDIPEANWDIETGWDELEINWEEEDKEDG